MSRFREVFSTAHVVLPIVHVSTHDQAARNVQIARDAGANGAFLISHGSVSDSDLLDIYLRIADENKGFWLGVNCLGWGAEELFTRAAGRVAGAWIDDALIDESQPDQPTAARIVEVQKSVGWNGLYFGGVAFKYQRPVRDLASAARNAVPYMDVVTTSGPGTGKAAAPEKIRTIKQAIGNAPLAIASGVTPENVPDYLLWADCFLVATGISYTFDELDPDRVRDLVQVVRSWPH